MAAARSPEAATDDVAGFLQLDITKRQQDVADSVKGRTLPGSPGTGKPGGTHNNKNKNKNSNEGQSESAASGWRRPRWISGR